MSAEIRIDGAALVLDEETVEELARRVADLLGGERASPRAWLSAERAAEYIACPTSRIYALVSAKRIPHHRDGSRLLFRPSELDEWVLEGGARRP